jgi:hypothetical protein
MSILVSNLNYVNYSSLEFQLCRYNVKIARKSVVEYFGTDIIFNHSFKYYKCVVMLPKFY